jgi:hypothetical protein
LYHNKSSSKDIGRRTAHSNLKARQWASNGSSSIHDKRHGRKPQQLLKVAGKSTPRRRSRRLGDEALMHCVAILMVTRAKAIKTAPAVAALGFAADLEPQVVNMGPASRSSK